MGKAKRGHVVPTGLYYDWENNGREAREKAERHIRKKLEKAINKVRKYRRMLDEL